MINQFGYTPRNFNIAQEKNDGFQDDPFLFGIRPIFSCYILETTPHPVTVTTGIIPFLVGNPFEPSFVTVPWFSGVDLSYIKFSGCNIFQTGWLNHQRTSKMLKASVWIRCPLWHPSKLVPFRAQKVRKVTENWRFIPIQGGPAKPKL